MSRSYISNFKILFDEHGNILPNLPRQVRQLTEQLLPLVANVSKTPDQGPKDVIVCWKKVARKRCAGKIAASIELSNLDIVWHCLVCGDHGSISNWQNTRWDGSHR
ncbi:hypothetical protein [Legionella sp. CNM-4043-24]|uniref:hypothetical protein n=1 Tax=Legionella sp. CNM-4043-24 TaxID=3421646 RepID=UPI00403A86B6